VNFVGDGAGNFALQRERIAEIAIVGLGPAMGLVAGLDELSGDADPGSLAPDASF
jgi:hypothetical protein